jgi:hypothetical protein
MQQLSIFKIAQIDLFYCFIANLSFASSVSFALVIHSRIRYLAVPVCKKCAKIVQRAYMDK